MSSSPRQLLEIKSNSNSFKNYPTPHLKIALETGVLTMKESENAVDVDIVIYYTFQLAQSDAWRPKFEFVGSIDERLAFSNEYFDKETGKVYVIENWMLKLRNEFFLRRFPFDREKVKVSFGVSGTDKRDFKISLLERKDLDFNNDPDFFLESCNEDFHNDDSDFLGLSYVEMANFELELCTTEIRSKPGRRIVTWFYLKRRPTYYFWNVFFVMFLIVGCSFVTYSIPRNDPGTRMSYEVTLLLTSVAYKFALASKIPEIPYLSFLDIYLLVCLSMLTFSVFMHYFLGILSNSQSINQTLSADDQILADKTAESLDLWWHSCGLIIWILLHIGLVISHRTELFYIPLDRFKHMQNQHAEDQLKPIQQLIQRN